MSFDIELEVRRDKTLVSTRFVEDSALVALVGPSGAGKTTILHCIAGLLRAERGHITIGGTTLFDSREDIDLAPEQRRCGYVFQDCRLFPHMSVSANLDYGLNLARSKPPLSRDEVVELLGLPALLERSPATLSGGETRRVAIARALLSAPQILLLDEPLASLDLERREMVLTMIEHIKAALPIPTIYVGHEEAEVARLTERVISISPISE